MFFYDVWADYCPKSSVRAGAPAKAAPRNRLER
jgi:hypothetical protein